MNGQSVTVGTFFGIQLRIHYSWIIIFVLIAWTMVSGVLPMYFPKLGLTARLVAGLITTLLFFMSLICHEYAHSLAAKRRGMDVRRITLYLLGGASELQQEPDTAKTELLMTTAGPAMSLAIAGISGLAWGIGHKFHMQAIVAVAEPLTVVNLAVILFNLLPAYPLDGGRIFRAIIWIHKKGIVQSTRVAVSLSNIIAYLMLGFGILEVLTGAIVSGLWLGLISFFLLQSARVSLEQLIIHQQLTAVLVKDVMSTRYISVPAPTPVESFIQQYVLPYEQYDFLVTDDHRAIGIIEFSRVESAVDESAWDEPVSRFMRPLDKNLRLHTDDLAEKALTLMRRYNLPLLPVYERDILVGIVSARRINDHVRVHRTRQISEIRGRLATNGGMQGAVRYETHQK